MERVTFSFDSPHPPLLLFAFNQVLIWCKMFTYALDLGAGLDICFSSMPAKNLNCQV